jgi:hypothetical protein
MGGIRRNVYVLCWTKYLEKYVKKIPLLLFPAALACIRQRAMRGGGRHMGPPG